MASLANQTISSTYDGLIKTSTDQPVGVSGVQLLEDGVGNTLALSVGRANQGVTVTGTLTATALSGPLTGNVTGDLTGTVTGTSVLADGVIATTQATSDNSTKVATTAFVKSVVTAEDLDIAADTGTGAVDLDSQSLTIAGTANEIETAASGQTITIGLPSSVTVGTLTATNLGGTLSTAAQANVTSVGTLTGLTVSGDVSIADKIIHTGDTDTAIRFPSADTITLETGGSERMRIDSSGNVGIGVTSPYTGATSGRRVLDIAGTSSTLLALSVGGGAKAFAFHDGTDLLISNLIEADGDIKFQLNNGERFRILKGGGITFNGDTAAANALDDYEEGTWTMGVSFGGASAGVTYSANTGKYTKIGRQVTVMGYLFLSSKGSSTGVALITGLPFTIPNSTADFSAASLFLGQTTFANQYAGLSQINTTNIQLFETTEAGVTSQLTNADFFNDSEIFLTFTYFV
jgi:hypothetical protein